MLYGKHLGLRGLVERLLESGDTKALELKEIVEGSSVTRGDASSAPTARIAGTAPARPATR